jgi:hypothetical protein
MLTEAQSRGELEAEIETQDRGLLVGELKTLARLSATL